MLLGHIDEASRNRLCGWASEPGHASAPVPLVISCGERILERTVANRYRADVEAAGHGDGRCGFDIIFNPPLSSARLWLIHVRSEIDGADIPGSPFRLDPAGNFDEDARRSFAAAIADAPDAAGIDDRLAWLDSVRDRLMAARAGDMALTADAALARRHGVAQRPRVPHALFLDDAPPDPDRDGGSKAALSHMCSLQRLGFEVSFAAPDLTQSASSPHLARAGITHLLRPLGNSIEELLRQQQGLYDLVYLHRVSIASCYAALVRRYQPRARVIYGVADLHHLRLARQAEVEDRPPELLAEARRVMVQELLAARMADVVITHSEPEAAVLRRHVPDRQVLTIPWEAAVRPQPPPFAARHGIVFVGSYSHTPNRDAARRIRDEIMPAVRALDPGITCTLVGDGLPPSLASACEGVVSIGHVPDLGALLDRARFTIAPLAFGAGIKVKVIDSLAAGVPCLCSAVAAEGIGLSGELAEAVVSDMAAMPRMIVRLYGDAALHLRLAEAGQAHVRRCHTPDLVDRLMRQAAGRSPAPASWRSPL